MREPLRSYESLHNKMIFVQTIDFTKSSSINFRKFQHEYTFILVLSYPYSHFLTCAVCNHVLFLRFFWPVNLSFKGESPSGIKTIIKNPHFVEGLSNWSGRGCNICRHEFTAYGNVKPVNGSYFASATGQVHSWNGRMAYNKISKVQCKEKFA